VEYDVSIDDAYQKSDILLAEEILHQLIGSLSHHSKVSTLKNKTFIGDPEHPICF